MKKITLLFICLLSVLDISAAVYSGSCGDNANYILDTETGLLSITGTGAMTSYSYDKTPWYFNRSYIKTVMIADGVTSIGQYAFYDCKGLTTVIIPNSVTSIGKDAFNNCIGLISVTIPNSVNTIGSNAFNNCFELRCVTIPNSVTAIEKAPFSGCINLTSISVEIGNTKYDSRDNCNAIIETSTNTLVVGCKNTIIPDNVTSIGSSAFHRCSGLTSVIIPNSVTTIGSSAFYRCFGLTSVTIPNNVTTIGESVFSDCSSLNSISVEGGNTKYDSRDNCNAIIETSTNTLIVGCKNTIIPNSVTSIEQKAFNGCKGLISVTIPNSVTSIGSDAFRGCSSLTSITIPQSVIAIGSSAFYNCFFEKQDFINNSTLDAEKNYNYWGAKIVDSKANGFAVKDGILLKYTDNEASVTIPSSVTSIGDYAFYECSSLTSITIPSSVTSIGRCAFEYCSGLTSVIIPNSITSIKEYAFSGCTGELIVNCNIPSESYSTFGVFSGSNFNSVKIGDDVTSIGQYAFYNCSGLISITIGKNVTSIGNQAFYGCSGLSKVTLNNNNIASKSYSSSSTIGNIFGNQVYEFIIGDDVTSIGSYAFYNCSAISSVTIPYNLSSVGDHAFDGTAWYNNQPNGLVYAGLIAIKYKGIMPENTSIIIKDGTVKLVDGLFNGCTGLTSIYIPSSVKSIGNNALANCSELLDVYCYARKSPTMGDNVFDNSGIQFATLYVPEISVEGYKATEQWSGFGSILALSGEYPEVPEITKCATPTIIFENGELSFSCETEGVKYIYNFSTPSELDESGSNISMPEKLKISVYATKEGFENSDVATKEIEFGGTAGIKGDVNEDETVNGTDIQEVINIIVNAE